MAEEHAIVVRGLLQNRALEHIVPDHSEDPSGPAVQDEEEAESVDKKH